MNRATVEQKLAEAKAERDAFVRNAEQQVAFRNGVVATLESLLADMTKEVVAGEESGNAEG